MPKNAKPDGFQPIEVEIGEQNAPVISEVDFSTPAPEPVKAQAAPSQPQTAAKHKED
jgi:hypothetical protein